MRYTIQLAIDPYDETFTESLQEHDVKMIPIGHEDHGHPIIMLVGDSEDLIEILMGFFDAATIAEAQSEIKSA